MDIATAELRAERDRLRADEARSSYRRRILQGQLDIIDGVGDATPADLVEALADRSDGRGSDATRAVTPTPPEDVEVAGLPDLSTLGEQERAALRSRLEAQERAVSDARSDVIARLDAVQAELVERYRTQGVDVERTVVDGD